MESDKLSTLKIKDIGRVVTGKTPPTARTEFFGNDFPFITPTDIKTFDVRYFSSTERGLSLEGYEYQKQYILPRNTICYVCIGSTIGKICLTDREGFTNQQINSLIVNEKYFDPIYIFYLLRTATPKIHAMSGGSGSGKAILNKSSFENIDVKVHPLSVQRKIAVILSVYDDLIETNTKRIKILEKMAQAIYKEWFVNFRFPGHEKAKMVKSELGIIPEGWEVLKIGELLRKLERKPRIKKEEYLEEGKIPAIDQGTAFIGGYTNNTEATHDDPLPIIVFGDHTRVVKYIDFPFASGADGTQLLYPENEELMPAYFYYAIKSVDISNYAYARHFKFLKEQAILIPKNPALKLFNENVGLFLKQTSLLRTKNGNFRKTRDLLLPKLISGEIDVENLDIKSINGVTV